uniref:Uncharacterized protein n=1 Tax=Rhizophora mucronata TaxID=61149 RepID=A0A2P2JJI3_RHIMU
MFLLLLLLKCIIAASFVLVTQKQMQPKSQTEFPFFWKVVFLASASFTNDPFLKICHLTLLQI